MDGAGVFLDSSGLVLKRPEALAFRVEGVGVTRES